MQRSPDSLGAADLKDSFLVMSTTDAQGSRKKVRVPAPVAAAGTAARRKRARAPGIPGEEREWPSERVKGRWVCVLVSKEDARGRRSAKRSAAAARGKGGEGRTCYYCALMASRKGSTPNTSTPSRFASSSLNMGHGVHRARPTAVGGGGRRDV